ncbi:MAG: hypothetical protein WBP72_01175 [Rhodocyclaceae bacterium]
MNKALRIGQHTNAPRNDHEHTLGGHAADSDQVERVAEGSAAEHDLTLVAELGYD